MPRTSKRTVVGLAADGGILDAIFASYTATHLFALALGIALLTFGRKLYWLALGGVGFFIGLWLASQLLDATGLGLGIGFLIGILGAWLAVAAQRLAVSLAGFFIGGALGYWTSLWLAGPMQWQPGPWLWIVALLGAVAGTFLAAVLFQASLIALTALFGALLIARASLVGPPHESWLFLILLCVGLIAQSGGPRRRRRTTT